MVFWCQTARSEYFRNCLFAADFPAQTSLGFTETGLKKEKIFTEQQFFGKNCLVDSRVQRRTVRLLWAVRKTTVYLKYKHSLQLRYEEVNLGSTAEDHGCQSGQLRPGNWSYSFHGVITIYLRYWKWIAWSDECQFLLQCFNGWVRIKKKSDMKAWISPYQSESE